MCDGGVLVMCEMMLSVLLVKLKCVECDLMECYDDFELFGVGGFSVVCKVCYC